jgi:hypothetical protein
MLSKIVPKVIKLKFIMIIYQNRFHINNDF